MANPVYTSYRGAIQVNKGGPLLVFTAAFPENKWRDALTDLCNNKDWENMDGPFHFVELHGVTADNTVHILAGDIDTPAPPASFVNRIKGLLTMGSPAYMTLRSDIGRYLAITRLDKDKAVTPAATNVLPFPTRAAAPAPAPAQGTVGASPRPCDVADFPVVMTVKL